MHLQCIPNWSLLLEAPKYCVCWCIKQKNYYDVNQMKYKNHITLMVGISAGEIKSPLAVFRKAKIIECFKLVEGASPPLPYKNQSNDYLDWKIVLWWIQICFWPYHLRTEGDVNAMLFLGNCSFHTLSYKDKLKIPKRLFVFILPPNVANTHQPDEMGIIASIKVGYKVTLLDQLLSIFTIEGG